MKFYYNPTTLNLLERQYEGQEPYWTETVPPFNILYTQFAKFEIDKWVIKDKKKEGTYCNLNDLTIINVNQFDDIDLTDYNYGAVVNKGDVVEYSNNKIKYIIASEQTLSFFKNKKLAETEVIYENFQVAKIVNGITFYTALSGKFYNETAIVRKSKATSREDRLMIIRVPAIDGKQYKASLPVDFYKLIDVLLDKISIKNNEIKAIFKMKLDKLVDIQEILDLQIKFLDIQTININDIADNFIADIRNRQEDRDYLASLDKKFFIEFNEAS